MDVRIGVIYNPREIEVELPDSTDADALKQQVDAAIQAGVFGVPYFVVDGEPIWGVDRMWMVEHWATRHAWRAAD